MQQIPTFRDQPEIVEISIKIVGKLAGTDKVIAEFVVSGKVFVVTVDEDLIDQTDQLMPAMIIRSLAPTGTLYCSPFELTRVSPFSTLSSRASVALSTISPYLARS